MLLVPRHDRRSDRQFGRGVAALGLALLVHSGVATAVLFLRSKTPSRPAGPTRERAVAFRPLSTAQFEKNRGPNAPSTRSKDNQRDKRPKETKAPEQAPGQVVDVAPGNGQVSDDARFAAETSNTVKKETRAKEQTAFYRNAMPQRTSTKKIETEGADPVDVPQVSGNNGAGQDDRPRKSAQAAAALEVPTQKAQSELTLKNQKPDGVGPVVASRNEVQAIEGNSTRLKLQLGEGGSDEGSEGRVGQEGHANLLPSPAVLDNLSGAAANDHLQDVDEGEGTYLNTREWKYAAFFNRVKQSVGQHWNPSAQLRLRDPTLNIYGGRDRHTLLQVTLTADGRLKDAWVEKSSGLDFLDLEAVQAFERAQPFPNPPAGLIASDQSVHFQFGFYLEMSGRPGLRLFRAAD